MYNLDRRKACLLVRAVRDQRKRAAIRESAEAQSAVGAVVPVGGWSAGLML